MRGAILRQLRCVTSINLSRTVCCMSGAPISSSNVKGTLSSSIGSRLSGTSHRMAVPSLMNMYIKRNINQLDMGQAPATSDYFVRVRGLPFSATRDKIVQFFSDVNVKGGSSGIKFMYNRNGRPSGEAYIAVASQEDQERALRHNRENMGSRYIEVFEVTQDEVKHIRRGRGEGPRYSPVKRGAPDPNFQSMTGHSVHMSGLPFSAAENDIARFFAPLAPIQIVLGLSKDGRKTGEADVDFKTHEEACEALLKDKYNMGRRYIELFLYSSGKA